MARESRLYQLHLTEEEKGELFDRLDFSRKFVLVANGVCGGLVIAIFMQVLR